MTMTSKELEDEVLRLRKEVADYARVEDYIEIWKLMSIYTHLYHRLRNVEIPALFAQKTPGVSVEVSDSGVYEGLEGVKRFFEMFLVNTKKPGQIVLHQAVNPVIEINKDGTRAKGLFHSPGLASKWYDGKLTAIWWYGKYNVEFVKEDGKWKILKLQCAVIFQCRYDKGWVEDPMAGSTRCYEGAEPDKPSTIYMPYNPYRINTFDPGLPEPYED